jgi:mannose-6-phosphate isomerase-like protein (cupin superfamily)
MQHIAWGSVLALVTLSSAVAWSQSADGPAASATVVSAEEIDTVVKAPGGGDREIKILDMGRYNLGVAVLRRGATRPGSPMGAINHTKVTEVYYVVSGSGTLVTGGEVKDIRPLAADNELVATVVGPGNNATFVKPALTRQIKTGDVVVIPAGVYHGFSEVPDHIEYVSVRPDIDKVLPGGYINPALKK